MTAHVSCLTLIKDTKFETGIVSQSILKKNFYMKKMFPGSS